MAAEVPCNFGAFFDQMAAQLVFKKAVARLDQVIPTAKFTGSIPAHFQPDNYALLWPQDEENVEDTDQGGGRADTRSKAAMFVVAVSRIGELDEAVSNRQTFLNTNSGHYLLRDAVRNALHGFYPVDAAMNLDGTQGMKWIRTRSPEPDPKARGWVSSIVELRIVYHPKFDPPGEFQQ